MEPSERARATLGLAGSLTMRLGAVVLIGVLLLYLRVVLVPLVLAILLSFLVLPLVTWLTARRVPALLAIVGAETIATLPFLGLMVVFTASAGPVNDELGRYKEQLQVQVSGAVDQILVRVVSDARRDEVRRAFNEKVLPEALAGGFEFFSGGVGAATRTVSSVFLTLLLCGFILAEGRQFRDKFAAAYGREHPLLASLAGMGHDVRAYVVAKTLLSALTAFCVWVFLELNDVRFGVFWALLAFPLNFIPTVGAVVASVPPMLVAMIDPQTTAWGVAVVVIGLGTINGVIGSVLDPRFVGQAVKLSPLVVFLSMLVWGTLWGPIGMILAVPLMVSFKLVCARVPALEPVAALLQG